MDADSIVVRVKRGAELLDRVRPGWAGEIDLASLNLGDPCRCTLGQLFGDFPNGLDVLMENFPHQPCPIVRCGFERRTGLSIKENLAEYESLTAAWVAEIEARRANVDALR